MVTVTELIWTRSGEPERHLLSSAIKVSVQFFLQSYSLIHRQITVTFICSRLRGIWQVITNWVNESIFNLLKAKCKLSCDVNGSQPVVGLHVVLPLG